jgi:ferrous iron transport protein A
MKLSDLKEKETATIKSINCNDDLKQRLYSFSIIQGSTVSINKISLRNNTIVVEIDNTEIILRVTEAKQIEVEKL